MNLLISPAEDHNGEEMDEFLSEIAIMKSISRHPNIVALIGYCTVEKPMLMVMEYVGCGDLVLTLLFSSMSYCLHYIPVNMNHMNFIQ